MKTKSIPLKLPSIPITIIRLLLLGISFLVLQTLEAQCYTDFKYAIGTPGADEAFDIVNAGNGDFFVVGTTVEAVSGKNVLVTKMNSGGAIIWTKVYGGTGTETVKKASATHDNGLLITGSTGSFTNTKGDIMCLKIDKNGNLIWLRKFGANSATGDLGMDITETNDGGYAVVGVLNALSSNADMIVLKLDINANIIWSKRFDEGAMENGIGILENGNNLIITSEVLTPGADYNGIITELDETSGNINKVLKFHPSVGGLSNAYIFKDASNNGYWISGHLTDKSQPSKMQQLILKLNIDYTITNTYKLVMPEYANNGYSGFQSLASGGFIACAGQQSSSSGFIYNIRKDGSIGFAKKLVGGRDRKLNRLQLIGNKIISVGSDSRSGNQEVFLIAFDSSGTNIPPCQTDTADLTIQSHSLTSTSYTWTSVSNISFTSTNATFNTGSVELNKTLLCSIACTVDTLPHTEFIAPDTICSGAPVTITNKTTGAKNFTWNFNADNNTNLPNILNSTDSLPPDVIYNKPGIYKISLIVNQGLPTETSVSKSIRILVSPYETTLLDTSLCGRDSITLETSFPLGTFLWNNGTNDSVLVINNPGVYWVETNYYGCKIRDSINILQSVLVKIGLSNDTTICNGSSIQLFVSGNNFKTYSWTPAATLSDGSSKSPIASPRETTSYQLNVTDINGCKGNDSIKVYVKPSPFVITIADTTVCSSDRVKLSTISSPDVKYFWSPSSGLSDITQGAVVATPDSSTTYTVTVTSPNGCKASDYVYLNVKPSPSITAGTTNELICSGANAYLTVVSPTPVTYKWSPPSNLDDASSATPIAKPGSTTNYVVEATSENGCKVYDTVLVSVKKVGPFEVEPSVITVCTGTPVMLKATGGDIYHWLHSSTLSSTEGSVVMAAPAVNTNYTVVITDTACSISDTLSSTVNIAGLSSKNVSKSNDVDCMLTSSTLKATGGIKYRWFPAIYLSDSTAANPVATPLQTTTYHVEITNAGGCTTIDSVTVYVYKGLIENGYQLPTAFTPNNDGNNDCYGVRKWTGVSNLDFSIYNRSGNLIFHTNNPSDCWDGTFKGIKQGYGTYIYTLRAQASCGVIDRKGTVVLLR